MRAAQTANALVVATILMYYPLVFTLIKMSKCSSSSLDLSWMALDSSHCGVLEERCSD